ncbi:hypothetical protein [Mesorhizobium sp. INR15]|uniref:COG3904 family protein n=1 Tax=Mesorhizobium sp. INR15 TaxID=2654248 RepID=UPI00189644FD|nr:hypothetical protein [Mesorhizobium sp. INR15]QPC90758.1 hypothetical protein GA829_09245 [Mesorhizobium sp. INR15]
MFGLRASLASLLFALVMASSAEALDYRPVSLDDGTHFLVVSGEFNDSENFEEFSARIKANGSTFVTFDSPGGSVESAIRLGRIIRASGLNTIQIRKMECASACSLAFAGGVLRGAEPGSIGVHRSSFAPESNLTRDDAVANIQAATAEIMGYLSEMGVDPQLLAIALRYDKADMRYLSVSEMHDLRLTNTVANPTGEGAVAAEPSAPKTATTQATASNDLEAEAISFVRRLIESDGTDPNAALRMVVDTYAANISYYGKPSTLAEVLVDKQRYFQRWPERGYHIHDNSVMATCANDNCMVSGVYDWTVRSLARNNQARGVARFNYTISLGASPKIVAEDGKVLKK